jgi:N-acetylglucosaminyl-diphospho-decaprenol L-rhamnosyltransferase
VSDVDVVIPTWNGWPLLERCLDRLRRQTKDASITVVDNGSDDDTAQRLRSAFPEARLVRLEQNIGFARAVNRGIAEGGGAYVVLLNNDVECDPEFIDRVVDPLRQRPEVGSVAGVLVGPGRRAIESYGLELDRTMAAFPRFAGAPFGLTALDERHLAGPSGGAGAYRRSALGDVSGFDEGLFAYLEDADIAARLRSAGWAAAGARDAVGVHLGSASFGHRSDWQVETAGASRGYLLRKYGVLRGRAAPQALVVEIGVAFADMLSARGRAAARGRLRGWRAGKGAHAPLPQDAINPELGFREVLRRRGRAIRRA